MQGPTYPFDTDRYAGRIEVLKRIRWHTDQDLIRAQSPGVLKQLLPGRTIPGQRKYSESIESVDCFYDANMSHPDCSGAKSGQR